MTNCIPARRLPRAGGIISDIVAKRYGMRGRLWWLWSCQTIGGVLCIGLGLANNSFTSTMVVLCFFSFFVQVSLPKSPDCVAASLLLTLMQEPGPCTGSDQWPRLASRQGCERVRNALPWHPSAAGSYT